MTRFVCPALLAAATLLALPRASSAAPIAYSAHLDGPSEAPPNASPGTGTAFVEIDLVAHMLHVNVVFAGLSAPNTAAHIHSATAVAFTGTAGVATTVPTFTGFPSGTTSGSYDHLFDLTLASSFNPAFVTANGGTPASAEAALGAGLAAGKAYLNIHTSAFPGGEIRGFLSPVPEPSSLVVLGAGLCGLAGRRRRRRSAARP